MIPTINDIAKASGVSRSTVSRVLNDSTAVIAETREKVLKAIDQLGYIPNLVARGLKTTTKMVGVITHDSLNPYYFQITHGIERVLKNAGYTMLHMNSNNSEAMEEKNLYDLLSCQVQGIILLSNIGRSGNRYTDLAKLKTQIVIVEGYLEGVDTINTDNEQGAREAIEYLIRMGHQRIGICGVTLDVQSCQIRLDTYKKVMKEHRLKTPIKYIYTGENFIEHLETARKKKDLPTAIFALYDKNAIDIYGWAKNKKVRIPKDLSVIGFDDLPVVKVMDPPLTTIAQPVMSTGELAAEMLLKKIKDPNQRHQNIKISTELIERESVKRLAE